VSGFDGFPERDILCKLCEGVINLVDIRSGKTVKYSCEGLYTRSGFMSPGNLFWIHADFERQSGKGSVGGYVTFENPINKDAPSTASKMASAIFGSAAAGAGAGGGVSMFQSRDSREDRLIPKYGYQAVPGKELPMQHGYRKHHPPIIDNQQVHICSRFKYRYVSLDHIVSYLIDMKPIAERPDRTSFNDWLTSGKFAMEFNVVAGHKVVAMFRGLLDNKQLEDRGVNFTHGRFSGVDFSYCTFKNLTFGGMQKARLIGCTFLMCIATGSVISGSDLSLCNMDQCTFEGLNGILTLNFGQLNQSSFAGCTFTVSNFQGKWLVCTVQAYIFLQP
jgi:hypothetical protein